MMHIFITILALPIAFSSCNKKITEYKYIKNATKMVQQHVNGDTLNDKELELLSSILAYPVDVTEIRGKRIAFVTGSSGGKIIAKADCFETNINPWIREGLKPQVQGILLSPEEKNLSGGYDVIVLCWVKHYSDKQRMRTIIRLGAHSPNEE